MDLHHSRSVYSCTFALGGCIEAAILSLYRRMLKMLWQTNTKSMIEKREAVCAVHVFVCLFVLGTNVSVLVTDPPPLSLSLFHFSDIFDAVSNGVYTSYSKSG